MAAVRLAGGALAAVDTARTLNRKFAENVAEFLTEEQPLLMKHAAIEDFGAGVVRLRDDVERTAKRIARIEQQLAQRARAVRPEPVTPASQHTLDLE
jgi:ubiquinone biosynthesis protein UbiJ